MRLRDHDLKQIDEGTVDRLSHDALKSLSKRLLADLKTARESLNQNSKNSSKPPSSDPPWVSKTEQDSKDNLNTGESSSLPNADISDDYLEPPVNAEAGTKTSDAEPRPDVTSTSSSDGEQDKADKVKRTAGKQFGAEGFGRTQKLAAHITEIHMPCVCACCNTTLDSNRAKMWTSSFSIDLKNFDNDNPGLFFWNTRHEWMAIVCGCGHENREEPYLAPSDVLWPGVEVGEWRLVGPRLAAFIALQSYRFRMSRAKIQEWLFDVLGLKLSTGTIDNVIRETGRCAEPIEEELIADFEKAELANADETSCKERGKMRWIWVFLSSTTRLFFIGTRGREIFEKIIMSGRFQGDLMTDGWIVYRDYLNRLRCWGHLNRKLEGLTESLDSDVNKVAKEMQAEYDSLQNAIYKERSQAQAQGRPLVSLETECAIVMAKLKELCIKHEHHPHQKLKAFAREMLNDWDVIMRQVREPGLPLTNNDAERALRHLVINRRISQGTRTPTGTRTLGLLATVVETCRLRKVKAWDFLTGVIGAARKALPVPSIPPLPT